MSDFYKAENPQFPCYFCGDFQGPMVDTKVSDPVKGRVYVCGPTESRAGCLGNMAHLFGMLSNAEVSELQSKIATLQTELFEEREQKTVTIPLSIYQSLRTRAAQAGNYTMASGGFFE